LIVYRLHLLAVNKSTRAAKVATLQTLQTEHSQGGIAIGYEERIARLSAHAIFPATCYA
jgi:hypothetical protein